MSSKDAKGVMMKQARRWLLLVAALMVLPHAAYAQKKKPPKAGNTSAPPAAPPAAAAVPADADAPSAPASPAPAGAGEQGAGGAGMDICQITPDAPQCTAIKEVNLGEEARKAVRAEIYAVQQQYVIKAHRFEIQPYWAFTLNDQFVSHPGPGLALNYYFTQVLAFGANFNFNQGLNVDSDFNFQNRRAARIAVPLTGKQFSVDGNFTYVPMYGKFAGFGDFIFHYDAYVDGGLGIVRTRPVPVIDPDNRKFEWNTLVNFDAGIGFRIFFSRWLAAVLEVRDIVYFERLENLQVATGSPSLPLTDKNNPLNPDTWYDPNTHLTNDIQAQIGISVFLPTSFEYTLPK